MKKASIKRIFGIVCLCTAMLFVSILSTACGGVNVTKEKLVEVNNTSMLLDQYQTITVKSTSTDKNNVKTIAYESYHKDVNGNVVMQSESKRADGKLQNSIASFDGLLAVLNQSSLIVSFVISDNWNAVGAHQFSVLLKNGYEKTEDIKIENEKIVLKESGVFLEETISVTHYFNKDTYLIEKTETTATDSTGKITFQGVEEFFYGKQIVSNSSVYEILSIASGNLTEVKVNYVDSNKSKIFYINKNAQIVEPTDYNNSDASYKIYSDSECTTEVPSGTVLGTTNALWLKKVS